MQWVLVWLFTAASNSLVVAQVAEPVANPTNIQFSNVKAYGFTVSFTPSVAKGFLLVKSTNPINWLPQDGVLYQVGEGVNNGTKVAVIDTLGNATFNLREVVENTIYYIAVFAFNGWNNTINYKQSNPLLGSVVSASYNPYSYFSGIDSSSGSFISNLSMLINPHTLVPYTSYKNLIIPAIYERDTIGGGRVVNCEYSNFTTTYQPPFDFNAQKYNREHALPKSWMPTGGNPNNPDGADYHNLLLTRDIPNQTRSNYPLGVVVNVTSAFGESKFGFDALGNQVFEPMDARKGDAARNMFYQMICYNGNGGIWGFDYLPTKASLQDQNILKLWNVQDPPDKFERTKDEYIFSIQGNYNPFIAYPGWVNCINWDSLVKTNQCGTVSGTGNNLTTSPLTIFPNPAGDFIKIDLTEIESTTVELSVTNTWGDIVGKELLHKLTHGNTPHYSITDLPNGFYYITLQTENRRYYQHLVIQH